MRHLISAGAAFLAGCFAVPASAGAGEIVGRGTASWYHEGSRVACGGRYDPDGITAAHRTLSCGSVITVTNLRNGRSVTVRITDRGPARWTGRIIDLSRGAARRLDMLEAGLAPVILSLEGEAR